MKELIITAVVAFAVSLAFQTIVYLIKNKGKKFNTKDFLKDFEANIINIAKNDVIPLITEVEVSKFGTEDDFRDFLTKKILDKLIEELKEEPLTSKLANKINENDAIKFVTEICKGFEGELNIGKLFEESAIAALHTITDSGKEDTTTSTTTSKDEVSPITIKENTSTDAADSAVEPTTETTKQDTTNIGTQLNGFYNQDTTQK